jgi:hypothetical protein
MTIGLIEDMRLMGVECCYPPRYRHMELYFGVSGSGAVLHTLNPRLFIDHIVWIINHAEDKYAYPCMELWSVGCSGLPLTLPHSGVLCCAG